MPNAEWHEEQIRQVAGDQIEAMSATVVVPAMLYFQYGGQSITQQVQLIGIDEKTQSSVSDFGRYLQHPANRKAMSFELREAATTSATIRAARRSRAEADEPAGWTHRREAARIKQFQQQLPQVRARRETRRRRRRPRPTPSPAIRPRRTCSTRPSSSIPASCWASPWPASARPGRRQVPPFPATT